MNLSKQELKELIPSAFDCDYDFLSSLQFSHSEGPYPEFNL